MAEPCAHRRTVRDTRSIEEAAESLAQLVNRGYEFFNRTGGPDFDLLDPEIEWTEGADVPEPQVFHGHDGVRRQQEAFRAAWESFSIEPERFEQVGDRLVVIVRVQARGKASSVEVEARLAHVWTLRHGKATRFEVYASPERALDEAKQGAPERERRDSNPRPPA
jgi:uncharacterized protein